MNNRNAAVSAAFRKSLILNNRHLLAGRQRYEKSNSATAS